MRHVLFLVAVACIATGFWELRNLRRELQAQDQLIYDLQARLDEVQFRMAIVDLKVRIFTKENRRRTIHDLEHSLERID